MPKVHHVKSARKANTVAQLGEEYYWWKFRFGDKLYSKTYPKRSQLTQSDKLGRIYDVDDSIDAAFANFFPIDLDTTEVNIDALISDLEQAHIDIADVSEEYQGSADSIREHFAESPTADECEERANDLWQYATEINTLISEVEAVKLGKGPGALDNYQQEVQDLRENLTCPV